MDILLVPGTGLFLLQQESHDSLDIAAGNYAEIVTVAQDSFTAVTTGITKGWHKVEQEAELTFTLPVDDPDRFLFLVPQVIDGLSFTPAPPTESGAYWFYGKRRPSEQELKFGLGKVNVHPNNTQFWFFRDVMFYRESFAMRGLWAKAAIPKLPGNPKADI